MTDVKQIFQRVLDTPAPPLTPAVTTLAVARRARQRRRTLTIAASCGAAAIAVAAVLAGPVMLRSNAGGVVDVGDPSIGPTVNPTVATQPPPTTDPTPTGTATASPDDQAAQHAQAMLDLLIASLPSGYTVPETDTATCPGGPCQLRFAEASPLDGGMYYLAGTDVYRGDAGSVVSLDVYVGTSELLPVLDHPCDGPAVRHQSSDEGCQEITTSTGAVARVSYAPKTAGRIYYASVAYPGITVVAREAPLGGMLQLSVMDPPVFDPQGLAELAALPELLP